VGYDVVHTHSAKAGAIGRLAAERAGTPRVVHTFHGFPFHEFQSRARRAAYVGIERYLGRRTDVFLAVGGAVAAEAVRRGIAAPERVRVINPAIDWPDAQASAAVRDAARRRLGVPVGCKIVGTVGRVDYQKAPETFVDALAELDRPDVYAVWIGDGPLRREMEQRAARRGLRDRFLCAGHRDDVPQLLPGLDVFAMASRYEGLPCAVAEAMMAGLPVVATAVNAVPDVVLPGETGLLASPEQPHQLAVAIRYMLDSPAEAARMAAAGRRLIADRFTPEALAAVLDAAYGSGVGSPPRSRRYVALARTA
jgi:glycosyltransferase involved in cell wall biosynthesis